MSEQEAAPASPAEDSEATASDASRHAADEEHDGSPVSTATDDARQGRSRRGLRARPEQAQPVSRHGAHEISARAGPPGRAVAAANVANIPGAFPGRWQT